MPEVDEDGEGGAPDLRDYARTLWRRRWLIILTVVVAVGAAVVLSVLQTPVYEATADLIIQNSGTQQILNGTQQNAQDAARNVDTETAVLGSRLVKDAAKKDLGHQPDVSVSSSATSDVVSVSARSTNARRAALDANIYAATYVTLRRKQNVDDLLQAGEQIQAKITDIDARLPGLASGSAAFTTAEQQRAFLQQQLDQLQVSANLNQVGGARILSKADVPDTPVLPQPVRNVAIALVLGLLVGIGVAFLREYLDDTITSREDLERASGELPVLGQIPRVPGWRDRKAAYVVTRDEPNSPAAEAYRTLRTSIQFLGVDRPLASIQVTSSRISDGKTTTIANLAIAFARAGRSVTIVCCDLRRPRIHEFFGLSNAIGFTSVMLGEVSVTGALQQVPGEANLTVLSAGPPPPNPSELLSSARAREVMASILKSSDLVLVDSPPVLPVSDALVVSGMVDATLIVASTKSSSRRALRRAVDVLRQVDAPLVGTVLNNVASVESYGTYGYAAHAAAPNGANGNGGSKRDRRTANRVER